MGVLGCSGALIPAFRRTETFVRKGGSRDWKNHFSREQSDRLDALFQSKLAGTPAANWWESEMRCDYYD